MEVYENKKVPVVMDLLSQLSEDPDKDQDGFCDIAKCDDTEIDCGECLFSKSFCQESLFRQWKREKEEIVKNGQ